ncbi:MAG TPA: GtrA family protein [Streptosporangiaceae bacterium]|jgi:putative flippase GtrA
MTVGALSLSLTIGGTNALHSGARLGPLLANAVANLVATCVSFAGNRNWTFRHRPNGGQSREFGIFFLLNGAGLILQLTCIWFTRYVLVFRGALALNAALIIGIGLGTVFRFWSYRRWVFLALAPPSLAPPPPVRT